MPSSEVKPPRTHRIWLILVAFVAIGWALRLTVFAPDPIEVRVSSVARGRVESTVTNSKAGTIEARRRSRIAAEIGGRVVEIAHREGARVDAGEALVRLAAGTLQARLDLAARGVEVAQAGLEDACLRRDRARRELARMRELAQRSIASADDLDELQYRSDSASVACGGARAELDRARAQLEADRTELEKTVIRAPFAGILAEVNVEVGEWVTPSPPLLTSPPVIDLIDPRSIYLRAPMDEVDSGSIHVGQRVKVSVDSRPGELFGGSVVRVAPYVIDLEAQNRTLDIEVELSDPVIAETLLPGTSADAEVILALREDVLRVSTSSLVQNERVLVLEEGELVERPVSLGLRNWQYAEILAGLKEGEFVVVSLDKLEIVAGARAVASQDGRGAGSAR
jgi:HlyD family secretion protein